MVSVVVDSRENGKAPKISELLSRRGVSVSVESLEYGDYWIPASEGEKPYLVERKEWTDLALSVKTGRIFNQLEGLKRVEGAEPVLIIEGSPYMLVKYTEWSLDSVVALILSISLDWRITCIHSNTQNMTATILYRLAARAQSAGEPRIIPPRFKPKLETPEEQALYIVSGLPGVSGARAVRLLERFGTVRAVFKAGVDELTSVYGIGLKTAKRITDILDYKVDVEKLRTLLDR